MHDLIKRSPVEPLERPKRTVCRVAERDQICKEVIVREGEDLPSELLILYRGVAGTDPEVGRGQHHQHRRVAEVVLQETGPTIIRRIRRDDRDRSSGATNVPRPLPNPSQVAELVAIVTSTKSHGCQFFADGASRPASSTFAKSSSLTGAEENSRTLRRDLNASHVSTPITLRPTRRRCPETDRARTLASSPFRSSHHQPRNRLAGLEAELGRDDLRPQTRIRQHALDVRARVAVTPVRTDRVPRFVPGAA